ncbi:carboxylesterase Est2 [[Clostridium] methylpentosum DSM 5476]|uniref:Carboxylesterase Est2 n=1 Tax=[Clostridium] methylpentosum DSM 5476 TaxID=537013 RepID=C0EDK5_9FIRM|nr:carboxylesterase Est2 [[Clostridium] methylpentosum DSM 5476]MDY3989159.1 alpha/beta hydrolase [Massilioclostridium sp.]MEE1491864.1 alpha/beta hydrolase [Massilioclostridium sp.]
MAINKAMRAALKALSYPDLDIKNHYKLHRGVIRLANPPARKPYYSTWDHKISCGDHQIPVRIFQPDSPGSHPVLLFFHGGGWVTGDINSYDKVCHYMAKATNHLVVSVDYRLAPEHRFPAAPEDCYAVARELFVKTHLLGARPDQITLIGDSAGGNLAAVVSLMARDRGEFMPKRQILIYPATHYDHTPQSPFESVRENGMGYLLTSKRVCDYMELYSKDPEDFQNPYFSPLLAPDLSGQPKTLLITAQYDPLRDEGEAYGQRLKDEGNDVLIHRMPDALHGFFSLPPRFVQVRRCYSLINRFVAEMKE